MLYALGLDSGLIRCDQLLGWLQEEASCTLTLLPPYELLVSLRLRFIPRRRHTQRAAPSRTASMAAAGVVAEPKTKYDRQLR
jgi:hypothetical protein